MTAEECSALSARIEYRERSLLGLYVCSVPVTWVPFFPQRKELRVEAGPRSMDADGIASPPLGAIDEPAARREPCLPPRLDHR